jgi:hypothetical protein
MVVKLRKSRNEATRAVRRLECAPDGGQFQAAMSASEAIDYGLANKIISSIKDLK